MDDENKLFKLLVYQTLKAQSSSSRRSTLSGILPKGYLPFNIYGEEMASFIFRYVLNNLTHASYNTDNTHYCYQI